MPLITFGADTDLTLDWLTQLVVQLTYDLDL
jgi:hypothetical protein